MGLKPSKSTAYLQAYSQFLVEVLQAIADSNDNVEVVYSLLAKNTDKLDLNFAEILRRWGTNFLSEAQLNEAKSLASVIFKFSGLIQQFSVGNRANNLEIAIAGYDVVLTVVTPSVITAQCSDTPSG